MRYSIKAHPTMYANVCFRSRLEARWACFFDLANWQWEYEPVDLSGWSPDFRVEFPCRHSECRPTHTLLVEVKPYFSIEDFSGHPCRNYAWGVGIPADASAAFGANPWVTEWEMAHGSGGGIETVGNGSWVHGDIDLIWREAGNLVQWHPTNRAPSRVAVKSEVSYQQLDELISMKRASAENAVLLKKLFKERDRLSKDLQETESDTTFEALMVVIRRIKEIQAQ